MKEKNNPWKKSKLPNLFMARKTGIYYAWVKVEGKRRVRSLRTKSYSEAGRILPEALREMRASGRAEIPSGFEGSLGDEIRRMISGDDPTIKASSRWYYAQCGKAILESVPGRVQKKTLSQVSASDMRAWQASHAKSYSPSRVNGAMSFLNRLFDRAMEARRISANPLDKLKRLKIVKKHRWLPSPEEFAELLASIYHAETAAAVELFAYSGLRLSEGRNLLWKAVKEDHIEVQVSGDFRTKNDEMRSIPLNSALRSLLGRLKDGGDSWVGRDPDERVMQIESPRIGLANACKRLGFPHLRVHDLRHLFATRCLEAGVDIPTVAKWMGHKDGGVLVAKTYAAVLPSHSAKQAERVAF